MVGYGAGLWGLIVTFMIVGGGFLAFLGFSNNKLPLGVLGIVLICGGVYFLVIKWSELIEEIKDRFN
ncbi:MAG: hypothetical protein ACYC99_12755 [Candidatus Geothermincolia bacterium]